MAGGTISETPSGCVCLSAPLTQYMVPYEQVLEVFGAEELFVPGLGCWV